MNYLIVILITLIAMKFLEKVLDAKKDRKIPAPLEIPEEPKEAEEIDYARAYLPKYILTKNEWIQYKKLKEITDKKNLVICPKVRLLDIIEPRRGEKKYKTLFYKIQSKHVDFVICDQNLYIKAIIELDDATHDREDRKSRDEFVDLILGSVGYRVIHTRYITENILDNI